MGATMNAMRAGLARGVADIRHSLTSAQDIMGALFFPAIGILVMFFLRNKPLEGLPVSLGSMSLPSMLGMNIAFGGLIGVISILAIEREDGTLLRAKSIPGGMTGYLVGSIVATSATVFLSTLLIMIPGLVLFDDVAIDGVGPALGFVAVLALGLVATMPIGAVLGSLLTSPRGIGLVMLPMMGLVAISGIFYPITALPTWVQWIGQAFPVYWLGLGMRSVLLPDAAAAGEIGESWRHLEMVGVLGVWAVLGLVFAPALLRRMARRESGSAVAARRERAMQMVR
ncbi:MAG: ABC transporter permease [Hamadaea sp.]|nr:ABC transporter permease [Hamadaea sp.]